MRQALERLRLRGPYRMASLLLLAFILLTPVVLVRLGAPQWLAVLPALAAYLALIVITYDRLLDAALSGGWIIFMILALNFGPEWHGPEPLVLATGNLLHLVPVLMGWIAPSAPASDLPAAVANVR